MAMDILYNTPLSPEDQLAFGLPVPQALAIADKVRFAELDVQNHANNKAYVEWFERMRIAYNDRFLGPRWSAARPRVVVHSFAVRFLQETLPGETYVATCRVAKFRRSSYTCDQQIWAGGTCRATMSCVLALRAPDGSGSFPIPENIIEDFRTRDGAEFES